MKYRVTEKMPVNVEGYKAGDIIEYEDKAIAVRLILKGYIEPLGMEAAKEDKMVHHSRRKGA